MDFKKLINLPVYTQSNFYLGRIVELEINPQNNSVEKYFVKSHNFIKNIFQGKLIITASQVLSISEKRMVVKDNLKEIKELEVSPIR